MFQQFDRIAVYTGFGRMVAVVQLVFPDVKLLQAKILDDPDGKRGGVSMHFHFKQVRILKKKCL